MRWGVGLLSLSLGCVPAGVPVGWTDPDAPFVALIYVDENGGALGGQVTTASEISSAHAVFSGRRALLVPIGEEQLALVRSVDRNQLTEASIVTCDAMCTGPVKHHSPEQVDVRLSRLAGEVLMLEAGASAFESQPDTSSVQALCLRTPRSREPCGGALAEPTRFGGEHVLPSGSSFAGTIRRHGDPGALAFFELYQLDALDADHVVALSRRAVHWFERGRDYSDREEDRRFLGSEWAASAIAREPSRRADGTWRVAIAARPEEALSRETPGILYEATIGERGIQTFEERYREEDGSFVDLRWIDGIGFVAVGQLGAIATATSASGPWHKAGPLPTREHILRVAAGAKTGPVLVLATEVGSIVLVESLFPFRHTPFPLQPGTALPALAVRSGEEHLTIWVGAVEGRFFRVEVARGSVPAIEQLSLTVDPEDVVCGGAHSNCGDRTIGYRFRDLQWAPGDRALIGALSCPGVLQLHPDETCATTRAPTPALGLGFLGVKVENDRYLLAGGTGEVFEIAR